MLRQTCATLLFLAGVPVEVIQERLGHKRVGITWGNYAHVLPFMQQQDAAASRRAALCAVLSPRMIRWVL